MDKSNVVLIPKAVKHFIKAQDRSTLITEVKQVVSSSTNMSKITLIFGKDIDRYTIKDY